MGNGLWQNVKDNVTLVLVSLGIAIALFVIAYAAEKFIKKKNGDTERILSTRKIAMIGVFSAIAMILHILDFPVPFAPPFYKLDFSELPVLIGTFAFGPVAGSMIELCKIMLKLLIKGTNTAFVGDLANFVNLTETQRAFLYAYQRRVFEKVSPYLNEEEREWLRAETRADSTVFLKPGENTGVFS